MANKSLKLLVGVGCWLAAGALGAPGAAAQCLLCETDVTAAAVKPPASGLTVEIVSGIDFSRLALVTAGQGGTATIDPQTGQRVVTGALIGLSGIPVQGSVLIRGAPNQPVQVAFPTSATLSTTGGGSIQLTGLTTTLKPNPRTEKDGTLRFTFGGRLMVNGASSGDFRGTIPITVDYR